jgi:hypothetical protein
MLEFTRDEKIKLFLTMARELPSGNETVNTVYDIVCKYDVPHKTDRSFIFDCLIAYYSGLEEYEKCALLLQIKNKEPTKIQFNTMSLSRDEAVSLRLMGFQLPDRVLVSASGSLSD